MPELQLSLSLFPDQPDETGIARFHVSDEGHVTGPAGYCRAFSRHLRAWVAKVAPETRRKLLPPMRLFLNLELEEGEDWRIWRDDADKAERRQNAFLESRGHTLGTKRPIDTAQELSHPSPAYGNFDRLALHRLYDVLDTAGLTEGNLSHLTFFATAELDTRTEYIKVMRERNRGSDQIGRRLLAPRLKKRLAIPVDPMHCVAVLQHDLVRAEAPEIVIDANAVIRTNGKRPFMAITASTLGWALKGLENKVACHNKGRGSSLCATLVLDRKSVV